MRWVLGISPILISSNLSAHEMIFSVDLKKLGFECDFYRIIGENKHYDTPTNPLMPSNVPGGCSSGSAVSVGAELVDFALGIVNLLAICVFFCLLMVTNSISLW